MGVIHENFGQKYALIHYCSENLYKTKFKDD